MYNFSVVQDYPQSDRKKITHNHIAERKTKSKTIYNNLRVNKNKIEPDR